MSRMTTIKTSELDGTLLNSFVAKCEGLSVHPGRGQFIVAAPLSRRYADEFDFLAWKDGGPIIERETIYLKPPDCVGDWGQWRAFVPGDIDGETGSTPLIAAMRAYVASKLGAEIEIDQKGAA